jgi:hypothetical protein
VTARVDWVVVGGPAEPWLGLGLVAAGQDEDGCQLVPIFGTGVEIDTTAQPGMRRLVLSGIDGDIAEIDGVPIEVRDAAPPMFAEHPLGVSHIDHVVIATDDLARTCGAIADVTGSPLKRVREAGEIRQGFHRVGGTGGLIVEVVERSGLAPDSASLWGFVFVVDDIHGACRTLGPDVISEPREAVQPGRFIATVRSGVGLGVPLALMSPDVR